mgnify:CR=1 FL=1
MAFSQTDDNEYSDDEEKTEFKGIKDEKKKLDLSRFRVGGDIGLGFASNTFFAEISPMIGYQIIKDRLEVGPGLIYQHQSEAKRYSFNNFGGQAYVRGYIFDGIFAQVDGFLVNFNYKYIGTNRKASFTYGNGFVGGGYAFNHKDAPFYLSISVKTNMIVDQFYTSRRIVPKIGFQFRL